MEGSIPGILHGSTTMSQRSTLPRLGLIKNMSANLTKLHYRGKYDAEYGPWSLSIHGAAKVLGIDMARDRGPPEMDDVMSAYPTVTDIHILDTKLNDIQHEYWITNTEVY